MQPQTTANIKSAVAEKLVGEMNEGTAIINGCKTNALRGDILQIRVFFVKNAQNLATAPVCKTSYSHVFLEVLSRICNPKQRFTGFEVILGCQIFRKQKGKWSK